jgi:glutamate-1-semialdehyde 2,1-aminomutase
MLDEDAYIHLASTTRRLNEGLQDAAASAGVAVQVVSTTGLVTTFFSAEPVHDYAGAAACDLKAYGAWCRALLERGVFPPPSQFEAWFPSLAHTDEQLDRTIAAAAAAFEEVA